MVVLSSPSAKAHIPEDGLILDLSAHANKLMDSQDIAIDLTDDVVMVDRIAG